MAPLRLALLLSLLVLLSGRASGASASAIGSAVAPWDLTDGIDGCALCRGGDCSRAVRNRSAGVFCGELQGSRQPCCCAYATTCAVDQFDDACRCTEPDELERAIVGLWGWGLLAIAAVALSPFSLLLELLARLLAVVGLPCQSLHGSLGLSRELCWSSARRPVAPAYAAVSNDDAHADAAADEQDKPGFEMC